MTNQADGHAREDYSNGVVRQRQRLEPRPPRRAWTSANNSALEIVWWSKLTAPDGGRSVQYYAEGMAENVSEMTCFVSSAT